MTDTPLAFLPKVRSKKITGAAEGKPCALRIASFHPDRRCAGQDTVVFAHLPTIGKGTSTKVTDLAGVFACAACHAILDGADIKGRDHIMRHHEGAYLRRMLDALTETQARLLEMGAIIVPDGEII